MKLIRFSGSKINEYIDIDIKFNEDLSILTGTNGSGKTTALNIIQAILLPKLTDIFIIPFEFIILEINHQDEFYSITISKNKEHISFQVLNKLSVEIVEKFQLPRNYISDFDAYKNEVNENKKNDLFYKKFINEAYFQFINTLPKPILIGLERTNNNVREDYKDYLFERNLFLRKDKSHYRFKDNLGVSSLETEMLIQNVYKRVKVVRDSYFNLINKELITSSFDFIDFNSSDIITNNDSLKEKFRILEKRSEIEETLKSIGFLDAIYLKSLEVFSKR